MYIDRGSKKISQKYNTNLIKELIRLVTKTDIFFIIIIYSGGQQYLKICILSKLLLSLLN